MSRIILILFGVFIFSLQIASARMYQWVDPGNGTSQLSGKPPVWYRNGDSSSPRVFVFERGGSLIDDTDIRVTDNERLRLRQQAFIKAEEDLQIAKDKMIQAKRLEASYRLNEEDEPEELRRDAPVNLAEATTDSELPPEAETSNSEMINEMRSIILDWELAREDEARALIE
jgi:hypothetical protein